MRIVLTILISVLSGLASSARAADSDLSLDERRAGMIINFARFTSWPTESLPEMETPLRIGIFGNDPLRRLVGRIAGPVRIHGSTSTPGRPVEVLEVKDLDSARKCHLVYFAEGTDPDNEILQQLRTTPTLSVGEGMQFIEAGGVLSFHVEGAGLGYFFKGEAMDQARLRIKMAIIERALKPDREGGSK